MNETLLLGHCVSFGVLSGTGGVTLASVQSPTEMRWVVGSATAPVLPGSPRSLFKDRREPEALPLGSRAFRKIIGGKNNS